MGYYDEDYDDWDDMSEEEKEQYRKECREDEEERRMDEMFERAHDCKCGAWEIINGKVCHLADCYCGAE